MTITHTIAAHKVGFIVSTYIEGSQHYISNYLTPDQINSVQLAEELQQQAEELQQFIDDEE